MTVGSVFPTTDSLSIQTSVYTHPSLSKWHKVFLTALLCLSAFTDVSIVSSFFPALVQIEQDLTVRENEIIWTFAAYACAFAAFMLVSGRVSDMYKAKWPFIAGSVLVGIISLICGFMQNKIGLFILRALMGIGAALTVPSAIHLVVEWFPDPIEKHRSLILYGSAGALGNVLGAIIGATFVQLASWKWICYFACILGVPTGVFAIFVVPQSPPHSQKSSWRSFDFGGVALISTSVILFVYAITSGSAIGWGRVRVVVPLIVAILLAVGFFVFEALIDANYASLPPRIWFYPNVAILAAVALVPLLWSISVSFQLVPFMREQYHWNPLTTTAHFLPIGVLSTLVSVFSTRLACSLNRKWMIFSGLILDMVATALLPFADTSARYWTFLLPAFVVGTAGTATIYTNANTAIFMTTPPEAAGTIGAIFNAALQLGLAIGLAVMTSIRTAAERNQVTSGRSSAYQGIADGYWFELALLGVITVALVLFYKVEKAPGMSDAVAAAIRDAASQVTLAEPPDAMLDGKAMPAPWPRKIDAPAE